MARRFLARVRRHAQLRRILFGHRTRIILRQAHLCPKWVHAEAHLSQMRTRGQAELALAERAEHLSRALGKTEVCVTVVDGVRLDRADLPAKVFATHPVVPLVQDCVGGD